MVGESIRSFVPPAYQAHFSYSHHERSCKSSALWFLGKSFKFDGRDLNLYKQGIVSSVQGPRRAQMHKTKSGRPFSHPTAVVNMQMNPPAASVACRVCFVKNPPRRHSFSPGFFIPQIEVEMHPSATTMQPDLRCRA